MICGGLWCPWTTFRCPGIDASSSGRDWFVMRRRTICTSLVHAPDTWWWSISHWRNSRGVTVVVTIELQSPHKVGIANVFNPQNLQKFDSINWNIALITIGLIAIITCTIIPRRTLDFCRCWTLSQYSATIFQFRPQISYQGFAPEPCWEPGTPPVAPLRPYC